MQKEYSSSPETSFLRDLLRDPEVGIAICIVLILWLVVPTLSGDILRLREMLVEAVTPSHFARQFLVSR